jgi:hypothetical protein
MKIIRLEKFYKNGDCFEIDYYESFILVCPSTSYSYSWHPNRFCQYTLNGVKIENGMAVPKVVVMKRLY